MPNVAGSRWRHGSSSGNESRRSVRAPARSVTARSGCAFACARIAAMVASRSSGSMSGSTRPTAQMAQVVSSHGAPAPSSSGVTATPPRPGRRRPGTATPSKRRTLRAPGPPPDLVLPCPAGEPVAEDSIPPWRRPRNTRGGRSVRRSPAARGTRG
ncbi:Uncharacterised protein [Mycobacteroides abscessus]|nr:Uncharacterised protein [Mycobacteroides abscessus]